MTWSIVTHDPATGAFAVAVATRAFAVGAYCPFVRAGVGAVSTQSMTNRYLGPAVLEGLARGLDPASAIEGALAGDAGSGLRQVHAVDRHGRTAAWTGRNCVEWCGSVTAEGVSVAGNMLAGEAVIAETLATFQVRPAASLPERLMQAMLAGAGRRRRPSGPPVRRDAPDHHRGLPRSGPAGRRPPRSAGGTGSAPGALVGARRTPAGPVAAAGQPVWSCRSGHNRGRMARAGPGFALPPVTATGRDW